MLTANIFDHAERKRSFEILAKCKADKEEYDGSDRRRKGRISRPCLPRRGRAQSVASEAAQRGAAGARSADHRSASPFLGHAAARALSAGGAPGRHKLWAQYRRHGLSRVPIDVPQGRPAGNGAGRRGRVRQRHRRDERLGRLWPLPRRRGDRWACRPEPRRPGARGIGSRDPGRWRAFPRHPPRCVVGRQ